MGVFDRVYASCPKCGEQVEFQSKAGKCVLASYSTNSVPMEIASDLNGETEHCPKCESIVKIAIPETQSTRIAMQATIGTGKEWD